VTAPPTPLLEIHGLSKRFTGTLALDDVDFEVERGEVHALLGENGAGKSTLIKILAGVYPPEGGAIRLHGRPVDPLIEQLPIVFIHQDLGLVDTMSVAENIAVVTGYPRRRGLISWQAARVRAAEALAAMGSDVDPEARVGDLSAAEKSIVAIARSLAVKADLLVLDEPTAALPEADVARLLAVLKRLRASGMGIVYVTHRLDEVFRIADRVTVLRDGHKVGTDRVADTTSADLVLKIVGRPLEELFVELTKSGGRSVLELDELVARGVGPVSLRLKAGEILGLVGLRGAGHDVVGRAVFGDRQIESGHLTLDGAPYRPTSALDAMRRGVGFVTSKRREEAMAPGLTVLENVFLNPTSRGTSLMQLLRPGPEDLECRRVLERFRVRPPEPERVIATLSGGNQQKVILARWMEAGARLLVLEDPTFGVDVGSKSEIYHLLQAALERGLAVLLISSDFEEVAGICHRALVFDRGRVVEEVSRDRLAIAHLTALATGGLESARVNP
jgi:ribose transport system ATP-binding protein